jgi:hypothetical protein
MYSKFLWERRDLWPKEFGGWEARLLWEVRYHSSARGLGKHLLAVWRHSLEYSPCSITSEEGGSLTMLEDGLSFLDVLAPLPVRPEHIVKSESGKPKRLDVRAPVPQSQSPNADGLARGASRFGLSTPS